ncbi:MAG: hypothetical protein ACP5NE_03625 [Candidatus Micrarchaeia archaeon]
MHNPLIYKEKKAQSAMEYLMTYGWAILIISVVLGALYMMGLFNPSTFISSQCIFPAEFSCLNTYMSSNGQLTINIEQSTSSPINITAIGCNTNATTTDMVVESPAVYVPIGSNVTFTGIQCWSGSSPYSGTVGSVFHGYIILNYTNIQTGFPHTTIASLLQKIT